MTYRLTEVEYPAVPVANLQQIFEAYISAGRAYEFGASVEAGVQSILDYRDYMHWKCPDEKFVLIGYSQGAMVVKDAAKSFDSDELRFVLTIGDPETYLPEGEGWFPRACTSSNVDYSLSRWRYYAPECHTYEGLFGGAKPYEPEKFRNKYSLMCNRDDFICGSSHNPFRNGGHTAYAGTGLVRDAVCDLVDAKYRAERTYLEGLTERPVVSRSAENIVLASSEQASPSVRMQRIDGDKVLLMWNAPPATGYAMISLNGVVLGYVEAVRGELEIRDLDYRVENKITVSFLGSDGETTTSDSYALPTVIVPLEEEAVVSEAIPVEDSPAPDSEAAPSGDGPARVEAAIDMPMPQIDNDSESAPTVGSSKNDPRNPLSRDSPGSSRMPLKITIALMGASGALLLFWLGRRR